MTLLTMAACFPPPPETDATDTAADTTVDDTAAEDTTTAGDSDQPDTATLDTAEDSADVIDADTESTDAATCPSTCPAPSEPCKVSVCDPEQGVCVIRDADDGATCDDGLFCTVGNKCVAGECLSAPRDCSDPAACTVDTCDDAQDTCVHDGQACECGPGVSCEDDNPCNGVDSCDLTTYTCVHTDAPAENVPCDDGKFCTTDDRCHGGQCAGVERACGDDLSCTADACDEANARCVNDPSACVCVDASGCPDSNKCDGTASCDTGQNSCDPGTPVVCTPPAEACRVAVCVPATGDCVVQDADDGANCDDQSVCTTNDQCTGGICGGTAVTCSPPNSCLQNAGCDPMDGCQFAPKPGECPFSTGVTGTCVDGTCQAPACDPACEHGGVCDAPNSCDCTGTGFHGDKCETQDPCGLLGPCPAGFTCTTNGTCENETEVYVPAGEFWMGCNEALAGSCVAWEVPQHQVTLSAYAIDRNKVTSADYWDCINASVCSKPGYTPLLDDPNRQDYPLELSHANARTFCSWKQKSLCTEAQWERAARGGCETIDGGTDPETCRNGMRTYPWGESPPTCELAVMTGCQAEGAAPVGTLLSGRSPYGVLDMAGNVSEWVADVYLDYTSEAVTDPSTPIPEPGADVTVRNRGTSSNSSALRTTYRSADTDDYPWSFRCCRPIP